MTGDSLRGDWGMGAHVYFLLLKIFFDNTHFKGLNDWCGAVVPFSSRFIYFNDQHWHTGTRKSPSFGNKVFFLGVLFIYWLMFIVFSNHTSTISTLSTCPTVRHINRPKWWFVRPYNYVTYSLLLIPLYFTIKNKFASICSYQYKKLCQRWQKKTIPCQRGKPARKINK